MSLVRELLSIRSGATDEKCKKIRTGLSDVAKSIDTRACGARNLFFSAIRAFVEEYFRFIFERYSRFADFSREMDFVWNPSFRVPVLVNGATSSGLGRFDVSYREFSPRPFRSLRYSVDRISTHARCTVSVRLYERIQNCKMNIYVIDRSKYNT